MVYSNNRKESRRLVIVTCMRSLYVDADSYLSTVELHDYCLDNGYDYGIKTFHIDLNYLFDKGLIVKDTQYYGKGNGTKCLWRVKSE